jgi:hypothetical protein
MCSKVDCKNCGKATWQGCGMHGEFGLTMERKDADEPLLAHFQLLILLRFFQLHALCMASMKRIVARIGRKESTNPAK